MLIAFHSFVITRFSPYLQGIAADGTIILSLSSLVPDLVVDDLPQA